MLFKKYELMKNHGEFVHLNMLKWALKQVPEIGPTTVPASESVDSIEIGTGGVDIKSTVDATGEEKTKHIPYTDVQVNGRSTSTFDIDCYSNKEARQARFDGGETYFDRYTKVITPDGIGATDENAQINGLVRGLCFYDKDTIKVDGQDHKYITKLTYLNRDHQNGTLTEAGNDKEFKPYTSVLRDDNSLASKMQIKHDGNKHLTGLSLPATGENYDVEVTKATLFNMVYPVGSIYMSANEVNPTALFGGTWEKIEDKFLLASSASLPLGTSGGNAEHTLTKDNIPEYKLGDLPAVVPGSHTNWDNGGVRGTTLGPISPEKPGTGTLASASAGTQYGYSIRSNGGGQAFDTMPPYLVVNMWKRTA